MCTCKYILLIFYICFIKYCIGLKSAYANIFYLHAYFIDLLYRFKSAHANIFY